MQPGKSRDDNKEEDDEEEEREDEIEEAEETLVLLQPRSAGGVDAYFWQALAPHSKLHSNPTPTVVPQTPVQLHSCSGMRLRNHIHHGFGDLILH